ncbi:14338_t:CDS:10 [Funneliformis mosseae]|uniref:14338_t:CDS:1 n=1 Tax=Funneliformis mosseae TaxID=27381 RepID=A0A9N9CJ58_FUNMO|nr:14338_t:CDS:10 [Funneliformis mosseae]
MFAPRSSRPLTVASYPQNNRGLRRKKKGENATPAVSILIELERILGLTTSKPTVMATAPSLDLVAYAAGSVVVLYNHKKNKQIAFLHASSNASPSLAFSQTNTASSWSNAFPNRHTIVGDGVLNPLGALGLLEPPANANNANKIAVSNKAKPISCVAFSPDGNYLAVGEAGHQPRILIWEVQSRTLVNELKGHKYGVLALRFSPNMKYIISLGFQHDGYLNVWNWKTAVKVACNKITTKVHTLAFSRNGSFFVTAGLRHVKFWYFDPNGNLPKKPAGQSIQKSLVQVLDGRSGILGDLRDNNFVDAACCQKSDHTYFVTSNGLLCMFTEGRLMDKWVDLQVKGALSIDVSDQYIVCACTNGIVRLFEPITLKYIGTLPKPHPLGVDLTLQTGTTYCVGGPNDVHPDTVAVKLDAETGKLTCIYSDRSFFIWDVKDVKKVGKYRSFLCHCDTIWGVEMVPNRDSTATATSLPENTFVTYSSDNTIRFWNLDHNNSGSNGGIEPGANNLKRNIYSKECLKIIYVDPDGNYKSSAGVAPTSNDAESLEQNAGNINMPVESSIRTLKISPDGKLMASGDRGGNLRVHDLDTFKEMTYQEAHDAEILAIEFTDGSIHDTPYLIATASRDRILHVFDVNSNFKLIQTLDDHSSSITAIKFTNDGGRLISCGADKMSGERRLNVFNIETGKNVRSYKSDTPEEVNAQDQGSLLRISLDPGGVHAVTAGSDKSIRLFDFSNGAILGKVLGHSELITGVKFTPDCKRIISTSADGCIFVWKVSDELVSKMRQKWLDRSGVLGQSMERNSPTLKDILSPTSSILPRTNMPAQRTQSLMMDLQVNDDQETEFTIRKGPLKAKKSLGSLTPADYHTEESSIRLKRPASFANDGTSPHPKPIQVTISRPVSEFSPTSPKSSEIAYSRLPQPTSPPPRHTVFLDHVMSTPPNSPLSPSPAKRESWKKLGLWAKKAFKEKEEDKGKPNKQESGNMTSNIISKDEFNPVQPEKSIIKAKSQSKLRQSSIKSVDSNDMNADEINSFSDNTLLDESLNLSPTSSFEENTGEDSSNDDNEDTETIYIESQDEEEFDETVEDESNSSNRRRRRGSFVGSIKTVEFVDERPKSPSGIDNARELEMYLQTPVESCFSEIIHNGLISGENDDISRKRQSLTMKFYSESQRESVNSNKGSNSLVEALTKIMASPKGSDVEGNEEDLNSKEGAEKALETLEGKPGELVSKECEANVEGENQSSSSKNTAKNNDKMSPLTTPSLKVVIQNENGSTIIQGGFKGLDEKGDGLEPITRRSTTNTVVSEVNEDGVMEDVLSLAVVLERTLAAYKKASSPKTKNESIAKLISESLIGMMDDIQKSIGINVNEQQFRTKNRSPETPEINEPISGNDADHDDVESNVSYSTALTTNSNFVVNGLQSSPPFNNNNNSSKNSSTRLSPLLETQSSPPSSSQRLLTSEKQQLSEGHTQKLLEKYSDMLVKMVEEKMSKVNAPSQTNETTTLVTSPIITNGTNANNNHISSIATITSISNGKTTKGRSPSGGIPIGVGRSKTSKSSRFV